VTDRDHTPDEAHELAIYLKPNIDAEVAIRNLRRALLEAFRPITEPLLTALQRIIGKSLSDA
jgi:hypothetical protein